MNPHGSVRTASASTLSAIGEAPYTSASNELTSTPPRPTAASRAGSTAGTSTTCVTWCSEIAASTVSTANSGSTTDDAPA